MAMITPLSTSFHYDKSNKNQWKGNCLTWCSSCVLSISFPNASSSLRRPTRPNLRVAIFVFYSLSALLLFPLTFNVQLRIPNLSLNQNELKLKHIWNTGTRISSPSSSYFPLPLFLIASQQLLFSFDLPFRELGLSSKNTGLGLCLRQLLTGFLKFPVAEDELEEEED